MVGKLRSGWTPPTVPQQQTEYNKILAGLSNNWPITRNQRLKATQTRATKGKRSKKDQQRRARKLERRAENKDSRGLNADETNFCYMVSVLQCLLHLPKFLNWVKTHNADGENLCLPVSTMYGELLEVCPACAMKDLAEAYWSAEHTDENNKPLPFDLQHDVLQPFLHRSEERRVGKECPV